MKKIFQNKIAKPLMLISVSLSMTACPKPDDELMNRQYTYSQVQNEICRHNRKHCVEIEEGLFFVEEGYLFRFDKNFNSKEYTRGFEIKEIVEYGGAVIGLQEDGDIYLRAVDDKGCAKFVDIGSRAVSIESNDKDLIALVRNGTVWIYEGEPGNLRITYMTTMIPNGNGGFTTIITPVVNGREVAFEKSEFSDVRFIDKEGDSIVIELESGEEFRLD